MHKIGVLGAGTWGMALARMLCVNGDDVTVWSALEDEVKEYSETRRHRNLPKMIIPDELKFTADIEEVCKDKDLLVFAVPSVFVRQTARQANPYIHDGQIIVDVAKGIEPKTYKTMTEVIRDELTSDVSLVALSGPTHAEEVSIDLPTTIVAACEDIKTAEKVQDIFMNPVMRVYTNTDVKGVEICAALKNIIALASGISAGLGYGDNAKAAIITRGLAEMRRLGAKLGCLDDTFAGLAGMGDLIVTATSVHSRNNRCGNLIGQGVSPEEAVKQVGMVVEGINAIPAAMSMAKEYDVEMPIVTAVDAVINHGADPAETVAKLMGRERKSELYSR
ncbi:MAG: NAD(P)-dependent glycerol-3-phosphate dehydrogenase [Mogibacterium sp.]|nr:NAD(P)-dependent glycerol-3-phosphate dehydrogenase [Mogibacterium sp.]